MNDKKSLRKSFKEKRDSISYIDAALKSKKISESITKSKEYTDAKALLIYFRYESEFDTSILIYKALADRKEVYLPRVEGDNMSFYLYGPGDELLKNSYGIDEPYQNAKKFDECFFKEKEILIITPALSVDDKGYRLGYGGGYYDKFLSGISKDKRVLICAIYDELKSKTLVHEDHDIPVDIVCTEKEYGYI